MADQGSEGLLSPFLRKQRIKAAAPHVKGRVLDVGCGTGSLSELVPASSYLGVDIDPDAILQAAQRFPTHRFQSQLPSRDERFNTVVSLAVIEHVPDPVEFIKTLAGYLDTEDGARIVITTPHPSVEWIHDIGSSIGLFSRHANEEHEDLLDERRMREKSAEAGLLVQSYSRFLFGANQMIILRRDG